MTELQPLLLGPQHTPGWRPGDDCSRVTPSPRSSVCREPVLRASLVGSPSSVPDACLCWSLFPPRCNHVCTQLQVDCEFSGEGPASTGA